MKVANIEQAIVAIANNGGDMVTLKRLVKTLLVGDNYIAARARLDAVLAPQVGDIVEEPVVQAPLVEAQTAPKSGKKAAKKSRGKSVVHTAPKIKFTTHPLVRDIDHESCPCNNAANKPCGSKVLGNGFCAAHGGKVDPNEPQQAKLRIQ